MHFLSYILTLWVLATVCVAADDDDSSSSSSSSASPTLVWVTGTDSSGITRTTQSPYYQSFMPTYTSVAASDHVESGAIGLGSHSGQVGQVRSYKKVTVTQANAAGSLYRRSASDVNHTGLSWSSAVAIASVVLGFSYTLLV